MDTARTQYLSAPPYVTGKPEEHTYGKKRLLVLAASSFIALGASCVATPMHAQTAPSAVRARRAACAAKGGTVDSTNACQLILADGRLTVQYPLEVINMGIAEATIDEYIQYMARGNGEGHDDCADSDCEDATTVSTTYDIYHHSKDVLSVRISIFSYTQGTAHPNLDFTTYTFDLRRNRLVELKDLFLEGTIPWLTISQLIEEQLVATLGDEYAQGSAKDAANSSFALLPDSIVFFFPPYAVASYASGTQEVRLPLAALSTFLKPDFQTRSVTTTAKGKPSPGSTIGGESVTAQYKKLQLGPRGEFETTQAYEARAMSAPPGRYRFSPPLTCAGNAVWIKRYEADSAAIRVALFAYTPLLMIVDRGAIKAYNEGISAIVFSSCASVTSSTYVGTNAFGTSRVVDKADFEFEGVLFDASAWRGSSDVRQVLVAYIQASPVEARALMPHLVVTVSYRIRALPRRGATLLAFTRNAPTLDDTRDQTIIYELLQATELVLEVRDSRTGGMLAQVAAPRSD